MSLVLERHASKDEILELYLNDVYLGQRGSFAIHGVAEAARLFFGKDVANLILSEAALIAGMIQSPATRSPFAHPERAIERRNVVLQAMVDEELHLAGGCGSRVSGAAGRRGARGRQRGALLRRHGQRADRRDLPGRDAHRAARSTSSRHSTSTCSAAPRRGTEGAGERRPAAGAAPARAAGAGGARRHRSAHRRDPRHGRRAVVQPVAVQPGGGRAAPARLRVQAVRLPGSVRARGGGRTHRSHAGVDDDRRALDVRFRRPDVGTAELRRIRRRDHLAAGAGDVAQPRDDPCRRDDRLRSRGRALAADRRRRSAAGGAGHHARRLRADAARSGAGLLAVRQRRQRPSAQGHPAHRDTERRRSPEGSGSATRDTRRHRRFS